MAIQIIIEDPPVDFVDLDVCYRDRVPPGHVEEPRECGRALEVEQIAAVKYGSGFLVDGAAGPDEAGGDSIRNMESALLLLLDVQNGDALQDRSGACFAVRSWGLLPDHRNANRLGCGRTQLVNLIPDLRRQLVESRSADGGGPTGFQDPLEQHLGVTDIVVVAESSSCTLEEVCVML